MFDLIVGVMIAIFLLWLCSKLVVPFLKIYIWLFVQLPFALVLWVIGILLCFTIILIPLGFKAIKAGMSVLTMK